MSGTARSGCAIPGGRHARQAAKPAASRIAGTADQIHRRLCAVRSGRPAVDSSRTSSRATFRSAMLWYRRVRSFRRQRRMIFASSGETFVGIGAGSWLSTAATVAICESPRNARCPVVISYSTAPNEKMSLRASTVSPAACSGDMNAGVPSTVPRSVCGRRDTVVSSRMSPVSVSFARPKSSTLTKPSGVTIRLPGFRSR